MPKQHLDLDQVQIDRVCKYQHAALYARSRTGDDDERGHGHDSSHGHLQEKYRSLNLPEEDAAKNPNHPIARLPPWRICVTFDDLI